LLRIIKIIISLLRFCGFCESKKSLSKDCASRNNQANHKNQQRLAEQKYRVYLVLRGQREREIAKSSRKQEM
jgi:hypothetical protein